jgi:hypothetical protein
MRYDRWVKNKFGKATLPRPLSMALQTTKCSGRAFPLLTDTVEKVGGESRVRNN